MSNSNTNNTRIAKNSILLYFRTILIMIVSLYTSRVVLNTLGVEDFGIYQAVGGVIAMFAVISGALSNSISRYITFGLGKGDSDNLNRIFCTSMNIQLLISVIVLVLCEIGGVWFLNEKMNIPGDRLMAANWILQCSLITFLVGLLSTPYNACIIAHEHMTAFAYFSILDAVLKLAVIFALSLSPFDKLITYGVLLVVISLAIRIIYGIYCGKNFLECRYKFLYDKPLFSEMLGFAGWNFFTNAAYIFNTQGISILVNMYFGVALNAARGIATQVDGAVKQFVDSFSMAVNPQITKSYATGDNERMDYLICKGARFSFFLLFVFCLPILCETQYILTLWLKIVPDYTVAFVRLSCVGSMITCLGTTGYTACMATGRIKDYVIWITLSGSMVFFFTWLAYYLGASVVATYWVYIFVYIIVQVIRLALMKKMLDFSPTLWFREVLIKVLMPILPSFIIPYTITIVLQESFGRFFLTGIVGLICSIVSILYLGLTKSERQFILSKLTQKIHVTKK